MVPQVLRKKFCCAPGSPKIPGQVMPIPVKVWMGTARTGVTSSRAGRIG